MELRFRNCLPLDMMNPGPPGLSAVAHRITKISAIFSINPWHDTIFEQIPERCLLDWFVIECLICYGFGGIIVHINDAVKGKSRWPRHKREFPSPAESGFCARPVKCTPEHNGQIPLRCPHRYQIE